MAEIGGVSLSLKGKHDKKGWKDTPGDFILDLERTTQQKRFALWFGISLGFGKREKERKKKSGREEKMQGERKAFREWV